MAIDIPEFATDEEKLLQIIDYLEELKEELGNIVDEMDADGRNVDFLDEGLEAIDDAIDSISDAVDELEEEESELDEEAEEDEEADIEDGISVTFEINK